MSPEPESKPEPFTCRWCGHEMSTDYLWCPKCNTVPQHITFAEVDE